MGLMSRIFGQKKRARLDAQVIYRNLMLQARKPEFFGEGKIPDTYEGRIEWLTFHMTVVMKALHRHGEDGGKLSQALFDEMVEDFDISLREEGLTDSGVKRRIKPMVKLFYTRLKSYSESETHEELEDALKAGEFSNSDTAFTKAIATYGMSFADTLSRKTLGHIAQADFEFPDPFA